MGKPCANRRTKLQNISNPGNSSRHTPTLRTRPSRAWIEPFLIPKHHTSLFTSDAIPNGFQVFPGGRMDASLCPKLVRRNLIPMSSICSQRIQSRVGLPASPGSGLIGGRAGASRNLQASEQGSSEKGFSLHRPVREHDIHGDQEGRLLSTSGESETIEPV